MRSVGRVVSFFAAGRRRRCSVLLFLQQLPELLNRLVQGPQLGQKREVELPQTELHKSESNYDLHVYRCSAFVALALTRDVCDCNVDTLTVC